MRTLITQGEDGEGEIPLNPEDANTKNAFAIAIEGVDVDAHGEALLPKVNTQWDERACYHMYIYVDTCCLIPYHILLFLLTCIHVDVVLG